MTVRVRHLLLVLSATCLVVGSGAFTAASVERGVSVSVADDEHAYLGLDIPEEVTVDGGEWATGTGENTPAAADERQSNGAGNAERAGVRQRTVTLFEVTNRFSVPVDVDATVESRSGVPKVESISPAEDVRPETTEPVTAVVTCSAGPPEKDLTLYVTASGEDVSVEMTRTVTVTCGG